MNKIKNFSTVVSSVLMIFTFIKKIDRLFIHFLVNVILPLHPKTVLGDGEITVERKACSLFHDTISSMHSFNLCCSESKKFITNV